MLLVLSVDLEAFVCCSIESISNILPVVLKYFRCFGVGAAELFWSETVNAERGASNVGLLTGTEADGGGGERAWELYFADSELKFELKCENCSREEMGRRGGRMWSSSPRM